MAPPTPRVRPRQSCNKMGERAIAIVIAPNLYEVPESEGPMEARLAAGAPPGPAQPCQLGDV